MRMLTFKHFFISTSNPTEATFDQFKMRGRANQVGSLQIAKSDLDNMMLFDKV